jgi:hypothetical protein
VTTFDTDTFLASFHQHQTRGVAGYCENCRERHLYCLSLGG